MTLCDVYDALTSTRPYKKAWSHEESLKEICDNSGIFYDPKVVEAFVALENKFKFSHGNTQDILEYLYSNL